MLIACIIDLIIVYHGIVSVCIGKYDASINVGPVNGEHDKIIELLMEKGCDMSSLITDKLKLIEMSIEIVECMKYIKSQGWKDECLVKLKPEKCRYLTKKANVL